MDLERICEQLLTIPDDLCVAERAEELGDKILAIADMDHILEENRVGDIVAWVNNKRPDVARTAKWQVIETVLRSLKGESRRVAAAQAEEEDEEEEEDQDEGQNGEGEGGEGGDEDSGDSAEGEEDLGEEAEEAEGEEEAPDEDDEDGSSDADDGKPGVDDATMFLSLAIAKSILKSDLFVHSSVVPRFLDWSRNARSLGRLTKAYRSVTKVIKSLLRKAGKVGPFLKKYLGIDALVWVVNKLVVWPPTRWPVLILLTVLHVLIVALAVLLAFFTFRPVKLWLKLRRWLGFDK